MRGSSIPESEFIMLSIASCPLPGTSRAPPRKRTNLKNRIITAVKIQVVNIELVTGNPPRLKSSSAFTSAADAAFENVHSPNPTANMVVRFSVIIYPLSQAFFCRQSKFVKKIADIFLLFSWRFYALRQWR